MQSIRSNALEPTRAELSAMSLGQKIQRLLPVYGLVILTVFLILLFSILLPQTFPTMLNLRSIISDKTIIAILSLAAMIPMAAGRIDLTIGYGIVLWHVLAISLQTMFGLPWPVAVLIVIALGALTGFLNGLLVEIAKIDSFIATLGTGTVLYAIALWHTGGRQVVGMLPQGFYALNGTMVFGLPITGIYVLALAFVMWIVLEYLPIGRYIYAIGANQRLPPLTAFPSAASSSAPSLPRGRLPPLPASSLPQAAHRPGKRRARISSARAGRRIPRIDHHQARSRQRLGHDDRRHHSGSRYCRHPAVRRLLLCRAPVQRRHPARRNRYCRLRPAPPQPRRTHGPGPGTATFRQTGGEMKIIRSSNVQREEKT